MHRIDSTTKLVDGNGAGKDGFTEGSPGITAATRNTDDWLNAVQEEICNVVEATGTLAKGTNNQIQQSLWKTLTRLQLNNWTKRTAAASVNFKKAATDGTIVCVVSSTGTIQYTYDGITYTSVSLGGTLHSIAYGSGYWVAVGDSGALYYATDPTGSWTSNTQGAAHFYDVGYGNGYWVAVGVTGTLRYRSANPAGAWTSNPQGSGTLYGVHYYNTYWVAVGASGAVWYTTNSTGAWTETTKSGDLYSVTAGLVGTTATWIAVGNSGKIWVTTGAPNSTWHLRTPAHVADLFDVAIGNGVAIAIGKLSTAGYCGIQSTHDGITFIERYAAVGQDLCGCVFLNGKFIVAGDAGEIHTSFSVEEDWS